MATNLLSLFLCACAVLAAHAGAGFEPGGVADGALFGIVALAAAAAGLQSVVFALTGNRIVSVVSGCLLGVQPLWATALGLYGAWDMCAAAALALLSLRAHLAAADRKSQGQADRHLQVAALVLAGASAFVHPSGFVTPALWLLTDLVFLGCGATLRRSVLALVALGFGGSVGNVPADGGTVAGDLLALLTLQARTVEGCAQHSALIAWGLIVAAAGAMFVALRGRAHHPRWLLLHAAFALTALTLSVVLAMPRGDRLPILAAVGPAFLLPALVWRALLLTPLGIGASGLHAVPPPVPTAVQDKPTVAASASPAVENRGVAPLRIPAEAEVRQRVDAAVSAAVTSSVSSMLKALAAQQAVPRPPRADAEQNAHTAQWLAAARTQGAAALMSEDAQSAVAEGVYKTLLQPFMGPGTRVVELGPSRYSAPLTAAAGEYVCVGSSPLNLEQARRKNDSALFVLGEDCATHSLTAASCDFVFSAEQVQRSDTAAVIRLLREVQRVLRPGGCAVLGFVNLSDALGREACVKRAVDESLTAQGALQGMTVETLRVLASATELQVDSVHLCVDGPVSFALLRPQLALRSSGCGE